MQGGTAESPYFYAGSNASYDALPMDSQAEQNPYSWSQIQGVDPNPNVPLFTHDSVMRYGPGMTGKDVPVGNGEYWTDYVQAGGY